LTGANWRGTGAPVIVVEVVIVINKILLPFGAKTGPKRTPMLSCLVVSLFLAIVCGRICEPLIRADAANVVPPSATKSGWVKEA
jgi:hypothetical protein